jgi:uncharacterized membrane protein
MLGKNVDILAGGLCALLIAAIVVAAPGLGPVRVALALPVVLFLPGYMLLAALYPGKQGLDSLERVALAFGISLAIVPLLGLALNYSPWRIEPLSVTLAVTLFILVLAAIAVARRATLPDAEGTIVDLAAPGRWWRASSPGDRAFAGAALVLVAALGAAVLVASQPRGKAEAYTEFFVLGPEGRAEGYPRQVVAGEQVTLPLGVTNHEGGPRSYRIVLQAPGQSPVEVQRLDLAHTQRWQGPVTFTLADPGPAQQVEFLLYSGDAAEPYRRVHLWLDARAPSASHPYRPRVES